MRRTCEHYYDRRLCEHEAACNEAEMCVLRIQHEEEAAHEEELQSDKLVEKRSESARRS